VVDFLWDAALWHTKVGFEFFLYTLYIHIYMGISQSWDFQAIQSLLNQVYLIGFLTFDFMYSVQRICAWSISLRMYDHLISNLLLLFFKFHTYLDSSVSENIGGCLNDFRVAWISFFKYIWCHPYICYYLSVVKEQCFLPNTHRQVGHFLTVWQLHRSGVEEHLTICGCEWMRVNSMFPTHE
jgi:hypothetical protein